MAALSIPRELMVREVVDLNDCVPTINYLDSVLESLLRAHHDLILVWDGGEPPKPRPPPSYSKAIAEAIEKVGTVPSVPVFALSVFLLVHESCICGCVMSALTSFCPRVRCVDAKASLEEALELALAILRFTSAVMERALSKQMYNSMEHLSNLLGARDQNLADAALECLSATVSPSRLQMEVQAPTHKQGDPLGAKLLVLAQGWSDRSQVRDTPPKSQ